MMFCRKNGHGAQIGKQVLDFMLTKVRKSQGQLILRRRHDGRRVQDFLQSCNNNDDKAQKNKDSDDDYYLKVILFINGGVFIEGSIMGHPQDVL